jgi:hypothetical protein
VGVVLWRWSMRRRGSCPWHSSSDISCHVVAAAGAAAGAAAAFTVWVYCVSRV